MQVTLTPNISISDIHDTFLKVAFPFD